MLVWKITYIDSYTIASPDELALKIKICQAFRFLGLVPIITTSHMTCLEFLDKYDDQFIINGFMPVSLAGNICKWWFEVVEKVR